MTLQTFGGSYRHWNSCVIWVEESLLHESRSKVSRNTYGNNIFKREVAQSCLTLCDPMDYTLHEILQARILEWVTFPFSRGCSQPRIEPRSPALQADSLPAEPLGKPNSFKAHALFSERKFYLLSWKKCNTLFWENVSMF